MNDYNDGQVYGWNGACYGWASEEGAKNNAQPHHTHIAVKYVEVKE